MATTLVNVLSTPVGATKVKIVTSSATQYKVVQATQTAKIFVVHTGESVTAQVVIS